MFKKSTKFQEGSILIIVALFLPVALGLLAFSIDLGSLYYTKSTYTEIGNEATSSAVSIVGDEMVKIVNDKINGTPPYSPISNDVWDNLTDAERIYLTSDPLFVSQIKNSVQQYLQKNLTNEGMMRNDLIIKNINVTYPYNYHLSDNFVKLHLSFQVTVPMMLFQKLNRKDILVKAESQIRIK